MNYADTHVFSLIVNSKNMWSIIVLVILAFTVFIRGVP